MFHSNFRAVALFVVCTTTAVAFIPLNVNPVLRGLAGLLGIAVAVAIEARLRSAEEAAAKWRDREIGRQARQRLGEQAEEIRKEREAKEAADPEKYEAELNARWEAWEAGREARRAEVLEMERKRRADWDERDRAQRQMLDELGERDDAKRAKQNRN